MAARKLGKSELKDIVWGSTLLGAGGGGALENGLSLVEEIREPVLMVDPSDLHDDSYAVSIAGIGSPKALVEKGFNIEAVHAYDAIKNMTAMGGSNVTHLIPVELGGFNSLVPFYVADQRNIPVLDADGCGRAVPELSTHLHSVYKLPFGPVVVSNKSGDIVTGSFVDSTDPRKIEMIARSAAIGFGSIAGLATFLVRIEDVKRCLVERSITHAETVGREIRLARESGADPIKAVLKVTGGKELVRGDLSKIEVITRDGFDFGKTTIEGMGDFKGKKCVIEIKNENILASLNGEPTVVVPDLIVMMTTDGLPLTNADTEEGMEVSVIAIPAPESWKRNPDGFACWNHILERIGYKGEYIDAF